MIKLTEYLPIPDQTAKTLVHSLLDGFISRIRHPINIYTKQGRQFEVHQIQNTKINVTTEFIPNQMMLGREVNGPLVLTSKVGAQRQPVRATPTYY